MFDPARSAELIKGALFDSEATWRNYLAEAGDWKKTAMLLTGPLIVAAALIAYLLGVVFGGISMLGLRPTLGSTFIGIVTGGIGAAIFAFIVSFFAKLFGGKDSFALGLAATTLAFVPGYVGQALSGLPWIGWLLGIGLGIYGLVLLWRIIPIYLEVPTGKRTLHYVVSLLTSIVFMVVLSAIFGGGAGPHFDDHAAKHSGMPGASGGLLGGIARQGELIGMAEEDRYNPPENGQVSQRQVEEFINAGSR